MSMTTPTRTVHAVHGHSLLPVATKVIHLMSARTVRIDVPTVKISFCERENGPTPNIPTPCSGLNQAQPAGTAASFERDNTGQDDWWPLLCNFSHARSISETRTRVFSEGTLYGSCLTSSRTWA
jgi:hypothetical protein